MIIHEKNVQIILKKGDITSEKTDAIVNAANSSLMGGGGVDGAIHRAGGPEILEDCRRIIRKIGSLKTGQAVITCAGRLPASKVIHTVGPVWQGGGKGEAELLASCYFESLKIAAGEGMSTLSFPSISTGIYGFPFESAARISFKTIRQFIHEQSHHFSEIRLVYFSEADYQTATGIANE
jgi:O-acetyl-ADP-ribose deacetylase (regulator of RNase III)